MNTVCVENISPETCLASGFVDKVEVTYHCYGKIAQWVSFRSLSDLKITTAQTCYYRGVFHTVEDLLRSNKEYLDALSHN